MRYLQLGFLLILVADAQTVTTDLDRSVSPCVNFYQFACGTWMAKNPIPADQSRTLPAWKFQKEVSFRY